MGLFLSLLIGIFFSIGGMWLIYFLIETHGIRVAKKMKNADKEKNTTKEFVDVQKDNIERELKVFFSKHKQYRKRERKFLYEAIPLSKYYCKSTDSKYNILFDVINTIDELDLKKIQYLSSICSKNVFIKKDIYLIASCYNIETMEMLYKLVKEGITISNIWDYKQIPPSLEEVSLKFDEVKKQNKEIKSKRKIEKSGTKRKSTKK